MTIEARNNVVPLETGERPPPGQLLPGSRYRILHKVGQGAMGVVYAAEHVDLEKRVALKLLLASIARKQEAVDRFRQEARSASKIGNPHICDVTDFGQLPDGRVFYVMEFLEGRSLRRILEGEGPLGPAQAIAILRQVCKALGAAHEKGIIHLDVKPDNVMVLERGARPLTVKVVDFGISELLKHQPFQEQKVNGTPDYIAPERATGRGYDHRSDVYSLGVTAYELLTGRVPFDASDPATIMKMQVTAAPTPMRERAPGREIPPELEAVVMQMLEKTPGNRPQSMAVAEAMLCEAQIAIGLRTPRDDLDIPAVDEEWRKKLTARMPSPRGGPPKSVVVGAIGVAAVALTAALYFGLRPPVEVPVKVLVTNTDEVPSVGRYLDMAEEAARARRFVYPSEQSALSFIERAEAQARKLDQPSEGAKVLRKRYARDITATAEELAKAELAELAKTKFKEALLFLPGDAQLEQKAALTIDERQQIGARASGRARAKHEPSPEERAKDAAAGLFLAARQQHYSDARRMVKALTAVDAEGAHAAKLADALRITANQAWDGGKLDDARQLYQLVAELDPRDAEALLRAKAPEPRPALAAADASAESPASPSGTSRRRSATTDDVPRDVEASQLAARAGETALASGKLMQAEDAFNRAVRADPMNAVAVTGVAEVAFERARYSEALDYARRAARLAPRAYRPQLVLGDAYFKLLRYREAVDAYQRAVAMAPPSERARVASRLERARERLGLGR